MKREGRQHGMVRCHYILPDPLNPRPETRYINRFDSPSTAGLFTKVSNRPTNHSKFTGKCGRPKCRACHDSPADKAKDKTKGTKKLRFSNRYGFSGIGFLAQMDGGEEEDYCVDEVYDKPCEVASLVVDFKRGDDEYENDEFCEVEDKVEDEDEGWCFVEEFLN